MTVRTLRQPAVLFRWPELYAALLQGRQTVLAAQPNRLFDVTRGEARRDTTFNLA